MSRSEKGQNLIETMAGFVILIPIALAAFDVWTLSSAAQLNEQIADTAARAAATQSTEQKALEAAISAVENSQLTNVITSIQVQDCKYDPGLGMIRLTTVMNVKMPIPFPSFSQVTCRADSVQPIVNSPAPR